MPVFTERERTVAEAVSRIVHCNPFLPDRIAAERQILGDLFVETAAVWHAADGSRGRPNIGKLSAVIEDHCLLVRHRLAQGQRPSPSEATLYEDLVLYHLYYRNVLAFERVVDETRSGSKSPAGLAAVYETFVSDLAHYFGPGVPHLVPPDPAHLFAGFFQVRRAFGHIYDSIVGASLAVARLRGMVWQSIFTHDMRRYRRTLFDKTSDFTTLVTGPSGTGKELVARAIGASRYIPFDAKRKAFTDDFAGSFFPLNLSAFSPTLVESELFGHRRGAFTGAVEDRPGWLQTCPPLGTVFLDEIGELDAAIQVKLLRVLQTRSFQRLGDTKTFQFHGKIVAATNRDLAVEMREGRFRRDLYYRLCSDVIVTPSLREQLAESPDELLTLVSFITRRLVGDTEADALTAEVLAAIKRNLGPDYPWAGNFRELEQCVRNVLIRGHYQPANAPPATGDFDPKRAFETGDLTADAWLAHYCQRLYTLTGSYEAAAKRLGLDRRTVRAKIDGLVDSAHPPVPHPWAELE